MIISKLGGTIRGRQGRLRSPSPLPAKAKEPKKTAIEQEAADLGLRLQIRDDLDSHDMMRLQEDVAMFIRGRLSSGNPLDVEDFVIKNKDHFTPEIKDMISLEIGDTELNVTPKKENVGPKIKETKDGISIEIKLKGVK